MKAPIESGSSGNSRKMNFAFPVSTYLALIAGQLSLWKAAQFLVEGGAAAAGEGGVFDDRRRRVGPALDVGQRLRRGQRRDDGGGRSGGLRVRHRGEKLGDRERPRASLAREWHREFSVRFLPKLARGPRRGNRRCGKPRGLALDIASAFD